MIDLIIKLLSFLVIVSQIGIVFYLIFFILKLNFIRKLNILISKNALFLSFVIAFIATLGSLFLSNVAGFFPCELCWFQRIMIYPQVLLFGLALWRKDNKMLLYGLPFSLLGMFLSGYHYLIQFQILPAATTCSFINGATSCAHIAVLEFGYITIPLMAFTAFLLLFLIQAIGVKTKT